VRCAGWQQHRHGRLLVKPTLELCVFVAHGGEKVLVLVGNGFSYCLFFFTNPFTTNKFTKSPILFLAQGETSIAESISEFSS
jgi:hypothetical protein